MRRYKIAIMVLIIVITAICLTGCVEGHMKIQFNIDGSSDTEFELLASSTLGLLGGGEEDLFGSLKNDLIKDGFALEDLEKNSMNGFKARRHMDSIEEFEKMSLFPGLEKPEVTVTEGLLFNTIHFKHIFKPTIKGFDDEKGASVLQMMNPDFKLIIGFPITPLSHNAPTVSSDGKTLEWPLSFEDENDIELLINVPNVLRIVIAAAALIIIIVLAIVLILRFRSKRGKTKTKEIPAKVIKKQ